jgi:5-deoxy-glucuronate isomerase
MITGASDGAEVAVCTAGAKEGVEPRLIGPADIRVETRGSGAMERTIHNILMEDAPAESLLVTEVLTPDGHWSSYPPHKHDRDAPPDETFLEETYYHRIRPDHGFGLQRVYTADGSLDESVAFRDGDVVLVPRGYHTVSAPPGYELYYLNVMAGPRREWRMQNDPEHEWLLNSRTSTTS